MTQKRIKMTEADRVKNQPYDIDVIPEPEHQSSRSKVGNVVAIIALIIIALGLIRILTWSIQPTEPLVVKNSPFPTRSVRTDAEPNGVIILTVDYCKNTDVEGDVRASFVSNTREVFLPIDKERLPEGCAKEEVPVLIPKDLPTDNYKLKFTVRYDLNPLKRQIPVIFESQEFHVNPFGTDEQLLERKEQ